MTSDTGFFAAVMLTFLYFLYLILSQRASDRGVFLRKKKVGPSYWGVYPGANPEDATNEVAIVLPKPCSALSVVAGSARYASGCAVKSAKG